MDALLWIILVTVLDGAAALIGVVFFRIGEKKLKSLLFIMVAFSAGTLLSGAFFHMMVESLGSLEPDTAFGYMIAGFVIFFVIERFLHWHHCHEGSCDVHPVSQLILIGDGVHNFIDGLVIASSFMVSIPFGIVTSMVIIGHELPQEIGDYAVLVYGGFRRGRALVLNFMSQLTAVAGGLIGYFVTTSYSVLLLPFAAGGFLYISASDLIPELHKEKETVKILTAFFGFLLGIAFIVSMKAVLGD